MKTLLILITVISLSGCATLKEWWEGDDPRVVEIRQNLEDILEQAIDEKKAELEAEAELIRIELELAKELGEAKLRLKLEELRTKVESIREALNN